MFNVQLHEVIIPVGANKRLDEKLNSKIGGVRYIEGLGKALTYFCGAAEKMWEHPNFSPLADLDPLHKQEVKAEVDFRLPEC